MSGRKADARVRTDQKEKQRRKGNVLLQLVMAGQLDQPIGTNFAMELARIDTSELEEKAVELLQRKGVDAGAVLKILNGKAAPKIDVLAYYTRWLLFRKRFLDRWRERRRQLTSLRRRYGALRRWIQEDPALSHSFKRASRRELEKIEGALVTAQNEVPQRGIPLCVYFPDEGWTVGIDKDLSRQHFWSPVVFELVGLLERAGHTKEAAFRCVAELFSALFGPSFPNNPNLIKQRYHRQLRQPA